MQIRLAELLEFIAKRYAKSRVLEEIDHQIDAVRRARRVGGRLRDFIRKEGLEPLYDRGRNKGDYEAFAVLLQQLKVDPHALLEIDRRLPPWEPWPEGRELIVFVGEKRVNSHTKLPRRGVGARDAQALAFLVEFLRITIGVEVPLIFHPLEDDRPDQAEKLFKKLLSKHKSGMFVA
ncbi:MAG: hypothetical protein KDC38_19425, partial [Planctomycetes bacterium]|nr:hypothetical protein [Planctomycetota bacterium]